MKTRTAVLALVLLTAACSNSVLQRAPEDISTLSIRVSSPSLFEIHILGNGQVVFTDFYEFTGPKETAYFLSQDELRTLVDSFYENDFFNFEDSYFLDVSDCPIITVTFSVGGIPKTVEDFCGSPPDGFYRIESLVIDSIGVSDRVEEIFGRVGP